VSERSASDDLLFLGREMAGPELHPFAGGTAAVYTTPAPDRETVNEDGAALIPVDNGSGVIIVADGLGGTRSADQAVSAAIRAIRARLAEGAGNGAELRGAILDGIEMANRDVLALGTGAATTLAVAEIRDGTVRSYHVGDSGVIILGQRGRIKLQTVPHSPVGFAVESGIMDEDEAMHHDERHIVSNVIGAPDMRIEVGSALRLAPRDTLLLASDGVLDNLHVDEIVSRIRKGPLDGAARELAEQSRSRMTQPREGDPSKPDDLTFVAFRPGGVRL
jgi:serine/threonine protein phosphatase PrpC